MSKKFNSLEEVIDYFSKEFGEDILVDDIPYTEENRIAVMDGLFWCGVEMCRFTYHPSFINYFTKNLWYLRDKWGLLEKEESKCQEQK